MSDPYFARFPIVLYNGSPAVDITKKSVIVQNSLSNPYIYFAQTIPAGVRSEQLARAFYNDPYLEWNIWMSNQTIDPYNEWYMDTTVFNNYIVGKYGSVVLAQTKVKHYINNWFDPAETNISQSAYDALPVNNLKYYEPINGPYGQNIGYTRVQMDWELKTNYIVSFTFAANNANNLIEDELVNINWNATANGLGQVALSTNNQINIQHVSGVFLPPNGVINSVSFFLRGQQSNVSITIANNTAVTVSSANSLPANEYVYYDPMYYFDWEATNNEMNKSILQMSPNYIPSVSLQLTTEVNS